MSEYKISISTTGQNKERIFDNSGKRSKTKSREKKGSSYTKHIDDYTVLDLETTGIFVRSARIVEISALKVRNNIIVGEYSTFVNPLCHIPAEATQVNHITDDMVVSAPVIDDVIDDLLAFIGNDVVVGYNNAGFDMNLIYDAALDINGTFFQNDYIDLLHAARRCIEGVPNYKLETISNHFGLDTIGEHRALKDCHLTKDCYDRLFFEFGDCAFKAQNRHSYCSTGHGMQYSGETLALRELHSFLQTMLSDGQITSDEVDSLRYWVEAHRDLSGHYPFDKTFDALDAVLEDGIISSSELDYLKSIFSAIVDPVKYSKRNETIPTLINKHACMTGEFSYGSRPKVAELIEQAGGIIDNTVKKATDYVVVGSQGSENWKTGNYGGKIQKAMEYRDKGIDISIIEEKDFIPVVTQLAEESFETMPLQESFDLPCNSGWKADVKDMLDRIIVAEELPEQSLYLTANLGRNGSTVTSYSICIYEPDYPLLSDAKKDPSRNTVALNIKEDGPRLELLVDRNRFGSIALPQNAQIKELKSDKVYIHVLLSISSPDLMLYIKSNVEYALSHYTSKESLFGCCGRFEACSAAKHCIHENKLYSKACLYRRNLEAGKIFYGVSKTTSD